MADPQSKYARVDTQNPEGWAICDRCGFLYNRSDLTWQYEWAGNSLYSKGILVCTTGNNCYDVPQEQLRTIILPPDPPPITNARTPFYAFEEYMSMQLQYGAAKLPPWGAGPNWELANQNGEVVLSLEYNNTQPNSPG